MPLVLPRLMTKHGGKKRHLRRNNDKNNFGGGPEPPFPRLGRGPERLPPSVSKRPHGVALTNFAGQYDLRVTDGDARARHRQPVTFLDLDLFLVEERAGTETNPDAVTI